MPRPACRMDILQVALLALVVAVAPPVVVGLDCFKCVSVGGNNPACDDPFHNNYTADLLESPCMGGRKGRNGVFPSTACLKLAGTYLNSSETMVVRGCGLDSGTVTVDTEIVRMSHCGQFIFDDRYVKGCLQSCTEDACNGARPLAATPGSAVPLVALLVVALRTHSLLWPVSH